MGDIKVWGPLSSSTTNKKTGKKNEYWQLKWKSPEGVIKTRSLGSKLKLTKSAAKSMCVNFAARLQNDPLTNVTTDFTIENLIDAWSAAYSSSAKTTRQGDLAILESLKTFFGARAKISAIRQHRADEWEKFVSRRQGRNDIELSEVTIRKYNGVAKKIFQWALQRGYIPANPFRALKSSAIKVDKEVPYTSPATFEKLAAAAGVIAKQHPIMLRLCRYAGLRLNECFPNRLPWTAIDFENRVINLLPKLKRGTAGRSTKTAARTIPIRPELLKALVEAHENAHVGSIGPCDRLSHGNAGRNTWAAIKRSGIVHNGDPHHSLRASAARDWIDMGESPADVARVMGHDVAVMQEHYLRDNDRSLARMAGRAPSEIDRLRTELAELKSRISSHESTQPPKAEP